MTGRLLFHLSSSSHVTPEVLWGYFCVSQMPIKEDKPGSEERGHQLTELCDSASARHWSDATRAVRNLEACDENL